MDLRRPTVADKAAVLDMMAEFEERQEAHDGGFWAGENFVYEDWVESNQLMEAGLGLPDGWVPSIQLVSFDADGRALGFLNLRLRLNDFLLNEGGHIGYSIRPSEQGKGYAREQLAQGLTWAREKNIQRVLVTCSQTNPASRAVIIANGGLLEDLRGDTERYWIDVN